MHQGEWICATAICSKQGETKNQTSQDIRNKNAFSISHGQYDVFGKVRLQCQCV